ncbi:MAG TPA: hypothetical protein PKK31_09260 [Elusimicrobiales bacterium]|nr:hypothetical protein [Elusimicrobiales bacterium]
MHILNHFFIPFALILIGFAIYFSEPETAVTRLSFAVLLAAFALNVLINRNTYRFMRWIRALRVGLVWLNLLTAAVLFYLLGGYWAPMWLLFTMPSAAGAMFMGRAGAGLTAAAAAALMMAIYLFRGARFALIADPGITTYAEALRQVLATGQLWGQAAIHALFIVVFALFVQAMSEMVVKMRDSMR